ncbi:MAG: DUF1549 domain-containing protein, partial [Verrucomicrobiales bacterium]|nr:DUF1549 domain-containing protein [Verrucomicrobiales bacterium]
MVRPRHVSRCRPPQARTSRPRTRTPVGFGSRLALALALGCLTLFSRAATPPDFSREVAPILVRRCLECHAGAEPAGRLNLTSEQGLHAGGDSGPAFDPVHPDQSLLGRRVDAGEMPPRRQGHPQPLPRAEVDTLRAWLAHGAPWSPGRTLDAFENTTDRRAGRDWWSLQPVQDPTPPNTPARTPIPPHPIDAFIRRELTREGWQPAPPADRRTLIRRVSVDLIGLPPSFAEIEAFVQDRSPRAYETLVDRLLDSPHFGERWARHWLDVARYAETCGYERDQPKPHVWKYRDWVVRAFNSDLPYDRFIVEQLAGDELPDRTESTVAATTFLRLGTWNDEPNDPEEYKYERLEDMVHATSTAFLGVTVKCARCHDHKFDPITQV